MSTKAGYVAILGKPNAGKSTLMNSILGQKLSITTNKPQTTRRKILGILSAEDYQIIFLDTPGILKPNYLLQEKMMESVSDSVKDADVIIFIVDLGIDPEGNSFNDDEIVSQIINKSKNPKILILNKIDLSTQEKVQSLINKFEETKKFEKVIPISATIGINIQSVVQTIIELLPENPKFYPDDAVTNENERFFVSEIIREKILEQFQEEIPYSIEVVIADFKERENRKDFIQAEIVVEKDSQKGIIIGKQGAAIKKLGQVARTSIEEFLERPVYLELRVKVRKKWRSDEKMLRSFGYSKENE